MSSFPSRMVSPEGVEVVVGAAVEANDLACRGYRAKIEAKAPAVAVERSAAAGPVNEIEPKSPVKPTRTPSK